MNIYDENNETDEIIETQQQNQSNEKLPAKDREVPYYIIGISIVMILATVLLVGKINSQNENIADSTITDNYNYSTVNEVIDTTDTVTPIITGRNKTTAPSATPRPKITNSPAPTEVPFFSDFKPGEQNTIGNTSSNLSYDSMVTTQGDWIYFQNAYADLKLYKEKIDGSEVKLISNNYCLSLNIIGDWIYYINGNASNDGYIHKVRTDGKMDTKIGNDQVYDLIVINDWMYYTTRSNNNLYKMKTDGSQKTLICSENVSNINIVGDWIYYRLSTQSDRDPNIWNCGGVYKIKTDGTQKTEVYSTATFVFNMDSDYIYIGTFSNGIWKKRLDGTGTPVYLPAGNVIFMNLSGDWIYYWNGDDKGSIYKIRTDGTQKTLVCKASVQSNINVIGDWIFFTNNDDHFYLYKVKTDGTQEQKVKTY